MNEPIPPAVQPSLPLASLARALAISIEVQERWEKHRGYTRDSAYLTALRDVYSAALKGIPPQITTNQT